MLRVGWIGLLALLAQAQPTFRSGTRLVEVDVVVRGERARPVGARQSLRWIFDDGPPYGAAGNLIQGLTKDDFTVLDNGRPQTIAVFSAGPTAHGSAPMVVPSGAISNRTDRRGQPIQGATAVLLDLLNTPFEYTDYARLALKNLLATLSESNDRVAVYSLGRKLHVLHGFGDDPKKLAEIAAPLKDFGDLIALEGGEEAAAQVHGAITTEAVQHIIEHLSGIPGRKNLMWLAELERLSPRVTAMLRRADISLYPVMVRCPPTAPVCGFARAESNFALAGAGDMATGGRGFFDARDLTYAFQASQEDTGTAYVLGYYPSEEMLDGGFHRITVSLRKEAARKGAYEMHYRTAYLATKVPLPPPAPTIGELFEDPVSASGIGLAGEFASEPGHPGLYAARVTIDLRDLHLDHKDGHSTGEFEYSVPNPSQPHTWKTGAISVDLTDAQLVESIEHGASILIRGVESQAGEIRVAVRDSSTGVTGSLRIPLAK